MAVRKVRTAAGVRRYDQPIGSIIVRDSVLKSLKVTGAPFKGWTRVKGTNGKEYDIGYDEDARVWVALEPDTWDVIADEGDSEEEIFELLDKAVRKRGSDPTPEDPVLGTAVNKPASAVKPAPKKTPAKKAPAKKASSKKPKMPATKKPAPGKPVKKMTAAEKRSEAGRQARESRAAAKKTTAPVSRAKPYKSNMKVSEADYNTIRDAIAKYDSEELRERYRKGDFPRSENVKDKDKRYRWDLYYYAARMEGGMPDSTSGYDMNAMDTVLRNIVPPLGESTKPDSKPNATKPTTAEMRDVNKLPYERQVETYLERRKIGATHDEAMRAARNLIELEQGEPQYGTESDYEPSTPAPAKPKKSTQARRRSTGKSQTAQMLDALLQAGEDKPDLASKPLPKTNEAITDEVIELTRATAKNYNDYGTDANKWPASVLDYHKQIVARIQRLQKVRARRQTDEQREQLADQQDEARGYQKNEYSDWTTERLQRMLRATNLKPTARRKMEAEMRRRIDRADREGEIIPDEPTGYEKLSDVALTNTIRATQQIINDLEKHIPLKASKKFLATRRKSVQREKDTLKKLLAEQRKRRSA